MCCARWIDVCLYDVGRVRVVCVPVRCVCACVCMCVQSVWCAECVVCVVGYVWCVCPCAVCSV